MTARRVFFALRLTCAGEADDVPISAHERSVKPAVVEFRDRRAALHALIAERVAKNVPARCADARFRERHVSRVFLITGECPPEGVRTLVVLGDSERAAILCAVRIAADNIVCAGEVGRFGLGMVIFQAERRWADIFIDPQPKERAVALAHQKTGAARSVLARRPNRDSAFRQQRLGRATVLAANDVDRSRAGDSQVGDCKVILRAIERVTARKTVRLILSKIGTAAKIKSASKNVRIMLVPSLRRIGAA